MKLRPIHACGGSTPKTGKGSIAILVYRQSPQNVYRNLKKLAVWLKAGGNYFSVSHFPQNSGGFEC
jgi:hypothetical protein